MSEPDNLLPSNHPSADLLSALGSCRWIDLSVTLANDHPSFWPGHMPFQRNHWDFDTGKFMTRPAPYQTGWWVIDEHSGTHFDAPIHFIPPPDSGRDHAGPAGTVSGEQVDPARFRGPACVVDVTEVVGQAEPGESPFIEPPLLERWEAENGPIAAGDVVIFRGGWDVHYQPGEAGMAYAAGVIVEKEHVGWPAPSVEAVAFLHERGVETIGTDGPTIGAAHDGMPVHWFGLEREIVYVESLARLDALPPRGAFFVFLPVKVAGATGGPGRAMGLLPG